jgi:hypothetical protein
MKKKISIVHQRNGTVRATVTQGRKRRQRPFASFGKAMTYAIKQGDRRDRMLLNGYPCIPGACVI